MHAKSILNIFIIWWSLGPLSVHDPRPPCSSIAVKMRSVLGVLAYFPLIFIRAAGVRQC
ncbi:hypothetical protein CPB85DRAFT_1336629 [Mucidula mucida]|nr:hypothetical protein CPB85DRAFT_1336629 [Mucidula mucida]